MNSTELKNVMAAAGFTYKGQQFGQMEWVSRSGRVITADWNGRKWVFCEFVNGTAARSFDSIHAVLKAA